MDYGQQAKIEMDVLTVPKSTLGSYVGRWEEDGVYALAELSPLNDDSRQGYTLEINAYSVARPTAPLGRKQQELASVLMSKLRERFVSDLVQARWQRMPDDLWHKPKNATKRILITEHKRTLTAKSVTVTCIRCSQQVERLTYPGPTPLYCEPCAKEVEREKTRERVAKLRAAQKTQHAGRG